MEGGRWWLASLRPALEVLIGGLIGVERRGGSSTVLGLTTAVPVAQQCGIVGVGNTQEVQALLQKEVLTKHSPVEALLASPPALTVSPCRPSRKHFHRAKEAKAVGAVWAISKVQRRGCREILLPQALAKPSRKEDHVWVELHHPITGFEVTVAEDGVPRAHEELRVKIASRQRAAGHAGLDRGRVHDEGGHHPRGGPWRKQRLAVAENSMPVAAKDSSTSTKLAFG